MDVSDSQRELVQIVVEDIHYFRRTWTDRCDSVAVRHGSVALRRLFIESHYVQAWHYVGLTGHPNVAAPRIDDVLTDNSIWWAIAGGGTCRGLSIQRYVGRFKGDGKVGIESESSIYGRPFMISTDRRVEPIPVREYVQSTSAILESTKITRHDIIAYMANKAGGAHLDSRDQSPAFAALRKRRSFLSIQDHDALSFELLSIGQCWAWTPETDQFLLNANALLGIC